MDAPELTLSIVLVFFQLSHSWTLPIGSLVVPIKELLSEPELVLDQWFHLDGASPESQILLRTELKVRNIFIMILFCSPLSPFKIFFFLLFLQRVVIFRILFKLFYYFVVKCWDNSNVYYQSNKINLISDADS